SVPNALMISASVRNDASFAQPYPIVTVTLSDARASGWPCADCNRRDISTTLRPCATVWTPVP
ncbi:DUF3426 domain-containing protein, partial [Rhodanobacter lindaniclasticus]